ncbi:MAG: carbon-nitrogen hydrolase family protein [Bacteroidetes bacterium]|nr:MAG: carbon-nitrogen hydrolase family protein [Bacteroidota bacterium]
MARPLKIAIVQKTAIYLDLVRSVTLALEIIDECATRGAQLVVFGECWLTGYPAWIDHSTDYTRWDDPVTKSVFQKMYANSVKVDGDEIRAICDATRERNICICIGINEVNNAQTGTIYNSVLIIDQGNILLHHQKLIPTYTEKLLYGQGDGRGLRAVDTSVGRIGALICWEHWMPLARQAMHMSGEEIHIALWPQVHDMLQIASRHYAFEGRCIVVAAGQLMKADQMPTELKLKADPETLLLNGGSCIVGAHGKYLMEPDTSCEDVLYYQIEDLDTIYGEKMTLDVSGHYQRDDVFEFAIKNQSSGIYNLDSRRL